MIREGEMRYLVFLGCLGLFFTGPASVAAAAATDAEVLTWQDCVEEARENHPDLVSAREKVNAAWADKGVTRSNALPQVNTAAAASTSKTSGQDRGETYSYGITGR